MHWRTLAAVHAQTAIGIHPGSSKLEPGRSVETEPAMNAAAHSSVYRPEDGSKRAAARRAMGLRLVKSGAAQHRLPPLTGEQDVRHAYDTHVGELYRLALQATGDE